MAEVFVWVLAIGFAFAYNNKREQINKIKKNVPKNIQELYLKGLKLININSAGLIKTGRKYRKERAVVMRFWLA